MSLIDTGPEINAKFDRTEDQRAERTRIITWAMRKGVRAPDQATQLANDIMFRRLRRAIGAATATRTQEILQEEVFLPGFQPDQRAAAVRAEADVLAGMQAFDEAMPLPDYQALAGPPVVREVMSLDDLMRDVRLGVADQHEPVTLNMQHDLRPRTDTGQ